MAIQRHRLFRGGSKRASEMKEAEIKIQREQIALLRQELELEKAKEARLAAESEAKIAESRALLEAILKRGN